jgi:hypothetical protein
MMAEAKTRPAAPGAFLFRVIARSEATKQSRLSRLRDGLLRFARNDD